MDNTMIIQQSVYDKEQTQDTRGGMSEWYKNIKKSPLTPPSWVFPIAWTILYILIIAAGVIYLMHGGKIGSIGFMYYLAEWVFNLAWSPVFFTMMRPDISFIIIICLLVLIFFTIGAFRKVSNMASYLLVPYAVWVSFATYLNGYIVVNN